VEIREFPKALAMYPLVESREAAEVDEADDIGV
jgi:hypothetical protein